MIRSKKQYWDEGGTSVQETEVTPRLSEKRQHIYLELCTVCVCVCMDVTPSVGQTGLRNLPASVSVSASIKGVNK